MKVHKDKDLINEIKKDTPIIIFFHMKGCGHCDVFKPIWKEICSEIVKTDGVKLGEIELSKMKLLPKNLQDVYGFPTIRTIKSGKMVSEYGGNRSKEDVLKYIRKYTGGGGDRTKEKITGGKIKDKKKKT